MRTRFQAPVQPRTRPIRVELREGVEYLINNSGVGWLIVIATTLGIFALPIVQQLPVISKDLLGRAGDTKAWWI